MGWVVSSFIDKSDQSRALRSVTNVSVTPCLEGGGEMGALMRAHDWSQSPLGHPTDWPDTLKMAVATCLSNRFPMVVWWGPDLIMLYNDAWQPILGDTKHPQGMGRPGQESWPETWPIVGKQFENALKGIASWSEDLLLASDRHGYLQECYFTYSHSPLRDPLGKVVGVLSTVSETTSRVLSERRLRLLRELSHEAIQAASQHKTVEETSQVLVNILANSPDVPFAALFLNDAHGKARVAAVSGIDPKLLPDGVMTNDNDPWGISRALGGASPTIVADTSTLPAPLPGGVWPEPTTQLVCVGMSRSKDRFGVLLVGVNSRLRLDEAYLDFVMLASEQLRTSLSALHSLAEEEQSARVNRLLVRELQHRTGNLLSMIRAISNRTINSSRSMEDYARIFDARLAALGRVQGLLSVEANEAARLHELVNVELATLPPDDRARIEVDGDEDISLPRRSIQLLALAVHELLTNAIKHGGLSALGDGVQIRWQVSEQGSEVALEWTERLKRPLVTTGQPSRGFGRILLEQALPSELSAITRFQLAPTGLKCMIKIPLGEKRQG